VSKSAQEEEKKGIVKGFISGVVSGLDDLLVGKFGHGHEQYYPQGPEMVILMTKLSSKGKG